jgi:hypothetical protein
MISFWNLKKRHHERSKTGFSVLTRIEMNLLDKFSSLANNGLQIFNFKKQGITSYKLQAMPCELLDTIYKLRYPSNELWDTRYELQAKIWDKKILPAPVDDSTVRCQDSWMIVWRRIVAYIYWTPCPGWLYVVVPWSSAGVSKISKFIVQRLSLQDFCELT